MKIFLIGFMGSGKTYWGRVWAAANGLEFYDLDEMIEKEEGRSVSSVFEENGEEYFRQKESFLLKGFLGKKNFLLACGGGTPCFQDNMEWMLDNGTTIFLDASPKFLLEKLKGDNSRPLINLMTEMELLTFIELKLKERAPFYNRAEIILPVDELSDSSLSANIF